MYSFTVLRSFHIFYDRTLLFLFNFTFRASQPRAAHSGHISAMSYMFATTFSGGAIW